MIGENILNGQSTGGKSFKNEPYVKINTVYISKIFKNKES